MGDLRRVASAVFGLVAGGLFLASEACADLLIVEPGERIQKAVKKARDGDTILVRPGRYPERISICNKKNLRIVSETLYGAHIEGDGRREIGFHDCRFRVGTATADGAPGTYIKGFLITDGPGYARGGRGEGGQSTLAEQGLQVIGAGKGWVIDSVRIERVANGIGLTGHDAMVVDTVVDGIERRNAHFLNAEAAGTITGQNPKLRNLTVSRATFTGCNKMDLVAAPAYTNCTKILQADHVVIEHVRSEDHKGSALWLDWRIRDYVIRFSRFANMQEPHTQKWMAALQIEGSQSEDGGPTAGDYEDGQVCFNSFEDNAFADIHLAESSNVSIYRNRFGTRSRVTLSVRDMGPSRHGAYYVSHVDVRDNENARIPETENQNKVVLGGGRGNRIRGATDTPRDRDLAQCAAHVRPAAYGPDCLGAFCGRDIERAKVDYDPEDFDPLRLDGEG